MEPKKTKGRQKIEMKKIVNDEDRLITFSKRRAGIYKKASELVTLCGAEVGILVFSPAGKAFSFGHPSMEAIANRFLNQNPPAYDNTHPLVEAHRKVRINELNQVYNDLVSQLEMEKERGKVLKQIEKGKGGSLPGWWQTPVEELNVQELQVLNANLQELHQSLCNKINERNLGASASFNLPHLRVNHAKLNNPLEAGPSAHFPLGYGYRHN